MPLSRRQKEILKFIRLSIRRDGLPPTRSEINQHFGFSSPNSAQCHLRALEKKGAIRITAGIARGIIPIASGNDETEETGIPLIGRVAAGQPIQAVENHERLVDLDPSLFRPAPAYLLRVKGESMIDAGILDQDLLAIHSTREARNGQIVVARINDEVTVKRLRRRGRGIWLEAANPAFDDLPVRREDDFAIEGVVVGVLRNL